MAAAEPRQPEFRSGLGKVQEYVQGESLHHSGPSESDDCNPYAPF